MPEYRHGALYVVEDRSDKSRITQLLKEVDHALFLEKQLTMEGEEVWCVVTEIGGDHPPLTIMEWRDEQGRPIPELASGLVERVKRMERDPLALAQRLRAQHEERRKQFDRRRDEALEEIARDMVPRIEGRGRPVLPRGVYLRQSRSRRREKGEIR